MLFTLLFFFVVWVDLMQFLLFTLLLFPFRVDWRLCTFLLLPAHDFCLFVNNTQIGKKMQLQKVFKKIYLFFIFHYRCISDSQLDYVFGKVARLAA